MGKVLANPFFGSKGHISFSEWIENGWFAVLVNHFYGIGRKVYLKHFTTFAQMGLY